MPGSELAVEARILAVSVAFALGEASEDMDSGFIADADACSNPRIAIDARLSLATSLRGKRGLELVDEALRRIRAIPEDQIGDLHYRLLTLRFEILWESRLGDANERSITARRAVDAARALGSEWAVLDMDLGIAMLESDEGRDDAAIAILEGLARRAGERHFATLRRQALINMATIKLRSGRAALAVETAREAADAAREAGNKGLLAIAQSIRAAALTEMGDMINARAAIEESVELKLAANDANVAVALLRRADIYNATGEAEKALADAELALARATQVGHPDQIAKARIWMAVHAVRSGSPNAHENLREVLTSLEPVKVSLVVSTRKQIAEAAKLLEAESGPSAPPRAPGS
jgi:tetratricopeptide (TPR) repeat protein